MVLMAGCRYFALNVLLFEEQYDVVDGWLSLLRRTYLCEEQYDHYLRGWVSFFLSLYRPITPEDNGAAQDGGCQVLSTIGDCGASILSYINKISRHHYILCGTHCR